jgi:malonyl-CoA O-methyltransferase
MESRLSCILRTPQTWVHWQPWQGGLEAHRLLQQRYPHSTSYLVQATKAQNTFIQAQLRPAWWSKARWRPQQHYQTPAQPCQMLWANMALHGTPEPLTLLQQWNQMLEVDGFVMFSCLGPDTLLELRRLYESRGWPPPSQAFTDMHDWGDMLVQAGFAEPVMDMERIRLSYSSPQVLVNELRQLGRNMHVQRQPTLRGRAWRDGLYQSIAQELQDPADPGRLVLTFEVIYGHAFKPTPRIKPKPETTFSLEQMQDALRKSSRNSKKSSPSSAN